MDDPNGEASALIWEQARSQLIQQRADLDALRTRALSMLSVSALVAGLFGTRLPHGNVHGLTFIFVVIALILFAASSVLTVLVAAPRRAWEFGFKLGELRKQVDDSEAAPVDVTSNLADWAELQWENNSRKIERLYRMFTLVCIFVGLQVVAWAVATL